MLLDDKEIEERIESPLNLLNRLRSKLDRSSPSYPGHLNPSHSPLMPPKAEDVVSDLEDKIKNAGARNKAMGIMVAAMDELKTRLPEVQKPEKLAAIAAEMAKVINQHDSKPAPSVGAQIIIYAPQTRDISEYEVIDVVE